MVKEFVREFVKRHIYSLPPREIFTSRHVLIYGRRTQVDSAIRELVNEGFICRLARGVFVRDCSIEPEMAEIVEAKLNAYRSKVSTDAQSQLHKISLYPFANANTFAKNGSSSSFMTIKGRAYLKNICERKMSLCQSIVGQLVYILWYLHKCERYWRYDAVNLTCSNLGRKERKLLWLSSTLMPAWLREYCRHIFPRIHIELNNPFQAPL